MKIEKFSFFKYSFQYKKQFDRDFSSLKRDSIIIIIQIDNYYGIGEASPINAICNESIQEVIWKLEEFKQSILLDAKISLEELLIIAKTNLFDTPSGLFAVESAIYDLMSKKKGVSIAKFLNKDSTNQIKTYDFYFNKRKVSSSSKTIKIKVSKTNIFKQYDLLKKVSQSIESDCKIILDANEMYDLPKAIRACKTFEEFNIKYIEQPIDKMMFEDLSELRFHTKIPIALDESIDSLEAAEQAIELQSADIFIIKPMRIGSYQIIKKIISLANKNNIQCVLTHSFEGSIGALHTIHWIASFGIKEPCGIQTDYILNDDFNQPFKNKNGILNFNNAKNILFDINHITNNESI